MVATHRNLEQYRRQDTDISVVRRHNNSTLVRIAPIAASLCPNLWQLLPVWISVILPVLGHSNKKTMQRVSGLACFNQYSSLEIHLGCCLYQYRCSLRVRNKPIIRWKFKKMRKTRPNTLAWKHSTLWYVVCLLIVWLRGWLPSTEQCVAHTWVRCGIQDSKCAFTGIFWVSHS